jgi:hypothetical protein
MSNTIELRIKVDELLQETKPIQKGEPPKPIGTPEQRFEKAKPKKSEIGTTAKALGVAAVGVALSNVGTITSSQAAQNQVNNAAKVAGLGIMIAKNPALGLGTLALTVANNAIKIAKETREWNLAETRNSERIGAVISQRGRR